MPILLDNKVIVITDNGTEGCADEDVPGIGRDDGAGVKMGVVEAEGKDAAHVLAVGELAAQAAGLQHRWVQRK